MKPQSIAAATLTVLITFLLTIGVQAQTKAQRRTPAAKRDSTPIAARRNSILSIETGVVLNSGEVRTVARTQFYLLDDSLENILRRAGLEQLEGTSSLVETLAVANASSRRFQISNPFTAKINEAIKPHIIAEATTDFSGKAQFAPVATKSYYLVGIGAIGEQAVVWNLKVDLKPGKSSMTLDQKNAATVF